MFLDACGGESARSCTEKPKCARAVVALPFFLRFLRSPYPPPLPVPPLGRLRWHYVWKFSARCATGLRGAEGTFVAGAETNAATGTGKPEGRHRPELRQHSCTLAMGSEVDEEEEEHEQPRQSTGGGEQEGELNSKNRQPELEFEEHRSTPDSGEEGCTGGEIREGGRQSESREHVGVLQGPGDGDGEKLAKPPGMPVPRPCTMDDIAQNSLLGALLSYQVRCCPLVARSRRFPPCRLLRSRCLRAATRHVFCPGYVLKSLPVP